MDRTEDDYRRTADIPDVGAGLASAKTAEAETVRALSKPSQPPSSPRRHPGDRGRFVGVPEPYRDRTGNARI